MKSFCDETYGEFVLWPKRNPEVSGKNFQLSHKISFGTTNTQKTQQSLPHRRILGHGDNSKRRGIGP